MKKRRISFSEDDAREIYELALEHFRSECFYCKNIKKRLEKFLGERAVKWTKKQVKKNPYCKNNLHL